MPEYCYLLILSCLAFTTTHSLLYEDGDEDTVIVNAPSIQQHGTGEFLQSSLIGNNRHKRQFAVYYPAILPAELPVNLEGNPCDSLKNLRGNCTSVSDCYPLIFSTAGEENREPGLVESFKTQSGICEDIPNIATTYTIFPFFRTVRSGKDLICCTSGQQTSFHPSIPVGGRVRPEKFVIGGIGVNDISKFPWLVSIHIRGRHSCGGSLINRHTVLTAAHCLIGLTSRDVSTMKIYFGHHDISQAASLRGLLEVRTPAQIKYHRAFGMRTLNDDIGLIILKSPIPEGHEKIKTVRLGAVTGDDKLATVAGWGQTSWTSTTSSRLLEATMDIWSNTRCQQKYTGFQVPIQISAQKQICAGSPGKDSCRGDSGSSLHVFRNGAFEQIGIVSFGGKCGDYPGVYTQPGAYTDWIQKNRKD